MNGTSIGRDTSSCGDRWVFVVRRKESMKVNRVLQRSRNDDG